MDNPHSQRLYRPPIFTSVAQGAFEATDLRLKFGFDAHSKLKSYIREHTDLATSESCLIFFVFPERAVEVQSFLTQIGVLTV